MTSGQQSAQSGLHIRTSSRASKMQNIPILLQEGLTALEWKKKHVGRRHYQGIRSQATLISDLRNKKSGHSLEEEHMSRSEHHMEDQGGCCREYDSGL